METPESIKASDSSGINILIRPFRGLLSHSHAPKLNKVPAVHSQVRNLSVHLSALWATTAPQVFTMIVKEVKFMSLSRGITLHLDDWLIRAQSQREALLNTKTNVNLTESLGWTINQKVRVDTYSGVLVCGLRIPPRLSPCKTRSRQRAKTTGFDPQNKVKVCFC